MKVNNLYQAPNLGFFKVSNLVCVASLESTKEASNKFYTC